jgi:hypothetical protein
VHGALAQTLYLGWMEKMAFVARGERADWVKKENFEWWKDQGD